MANATHLEKIREGHKAWNSWREDNPDIAPDLTGADLTGIDLSKCNLSFAKVKGVKFNYESISCTNFMDKKSSQGLEVLKGLLS